MSKEPETLEEALEEIRRLRFAKRLEWDIVLSQDFDGGDGYEVPRYPTAGEECNITVTLEGGDQVWEFHGMKTHRSPTDVSELSESTDADGEPMTVQTTRKYYGKCKK